MLSRDRTIGAVLAALWVLMCPSASRPATGQKPAGTPAATNPPPSPSPPPRRAWPWSPSTACASECWRRRATNPRSVGEAAPN